MAELVRNGSRNINAIEHHNNYCGTLSSIARAMEEYVKLIEGPAPSDVADAACPEGHNSPTTLDLTITVLPPAVGGSEPRAQKVQTKTLSQENQDYVQRHVQYLKDLVEANIKFHPLLDDDDNDTDLAAFFAEDHKTTPPEYKGKTLIFYDQKICQEASSRPKYRVAALNSKNYEHLIGSALRRQDAETGCAVEVTATDVFVIFNGGLDSNTGETCRFLTPFRKRKHALQVMFILKSLESMRQRMKRMDGVGGLRQLECVHIVSNTGLTFDDMPQKAFKRCGGSAGGDVIGPVSLPSIRDQWCVDLKAKRAILGIRGFAQMGGRAAGVNDDVAVDDDSDNEDFVPLFHHCMGGGVAADFIDIFGQCKLVYDLTAGTPDVALAALAANRRYRGICLNPKHKAALEGRLHDLLVTATATATSTLYDAHFVKVLVPAAAAAVNDAADTPKSTKRKFDKADLGAGEKASKSTKKSKKKAPKGLKRLDIKKAMAKKDQDQEQPDQAEKEDAEEDQEEDGADNINEEEDGALDEEIFSGEL